jgi:hypothetical protein
MGKTRTQGWNHTNAPPPADTPQPVAVPEAVPEPLPICRKCGQTKARDDDYLCAICRRAVTCEFDTNGDGNCGRQTCPQCNPPAMPPPANPNGTTGTAAAAKKRTRQPVGMSALTARIRRMILRLPAKQRRLAIQVIDAEFDERGEVIDLFREPNTATS